VIGYNKDFVKYIILEEQILIFYDNEETYKYKAIALQKPINPKES
jgi:hypothetical protein